MFGGKAALPLCFLITTLTAAEPLDFDPLRLPAVGDSTLRILSPALLELEFINTKEKGPAPVTSWDFGAHPPETKDIKVEVNGAAAPIKRTGFRRRVVYAPLKRRDLRIGNHLFLELEREIPAEAQVRVTNPAGNLWLASARFETRASAHRFSPVLHVNQVGYDPSSPKKAMAGYYLGNAGEMIIGGTAGFDLLDADTRKPAFHGKLTRRADKGYTFPCYQQVVEADFSEFKKPGWYRLSIPGFGDSFPFQIGEGVFDEYARALALGIYHQRCGTGNDLPFTRFTHAPCHTAPAEVPDASFKATQSFLKEMTGDTKDVPGHTAKPLSNTEASLYPFVRRGKVDVSGGHHDAGDYSKYTINSASFIHHMVFAADAFPGAGELDDLGLPESGDGKSDLLQEAKWEADFLCKMQDTDGGFYFLVYPRERQYEDDVLPDKGDPQVVFPKNTSATAASVAALAQTASSPRFKKQFPDAAKKYLAQAQEGWKFLQRAIAKHGRAGAYQKITHYGNEFLHEDELAWAAVEIFLATGDPSAHSFFLKSFDPTSRDTKRWTWWRLFEAYGNAIRSYAFAQQTRGLKASQLDAAFLKKCEEEILASAEDQTRFTRECAYATAFPDPSKRFRSAGWYFSLDRAFDIATAASLQQSSPKRGEWLDAIVGNLNYEGGCNPVNMPCITGVGWKRQREIVHHYAQNDDRALPPSGIPLGNVQSGFQYLHHYEKELGTLSFPPDGAQDEPYPFYDRWGDSFNVTTEFVVVNQARALGTLAFLIGEKKRAPAGKPPKAVIESSWNGKALEAKLLIDGAAPPAHSRIVWEAQKQEPRFGDASGAARFEALPPGDYRVEAEAELPDGRRVFARSQAMIK